LGRWLNRDPINENGGINLYISFRNDFINKLDHLGCEVLSLFIRYPNGNTDTYITIEDIVYGYITKGQYYRVPSLYGKSNMIVKDYHLTIFGKGKKTILSDVIFKDKANYFNTEKKEVIKKTISLILSVGGATTGLTDKPHKVAEFFGKLGQIDTSISTVNSALESTIEQNWLWEASGFIPLWSVIKSAVDLLTYESKSIEPFDQIPVNGFENAKVGKIIDLTCEIDRTNVNYKKISESIMKYHGF